MKIGQAVPGAKGSFGIPPELKERGDVLLKNSEEASSRRPGMDEVPGDESPRAPTPYIDGGIPEEAFESKTEQSIADMITPEENLARLGINLVEDDYHSIVFRGFLEKEVVVFPAISKTRELRATIKTLKAAEYDLVDELMADDIRNVPMTNEGYSARRSLWILSVAVTRLDGKPLTKPIYTKDYDGKNVVDVKATAKDRKLKILGEMSHIVLNELVALHAALTTNMDLILNEGKRAYLKKLLPPR